MLLKRTIAPHIIQIKNYKRFSLSKILNMFSAHSSSLIKSSLPILIALMFVSFARAEDEKPLTFLNASLDEENALELSVISGKDIFLPFTGTEDLMGKTIDLYLTSFTSEQGNNIVIKPSIVELPELKPFNQHLTFSLDKPLLTLRLTIPELPTAGNYTGNLIVQCDNEVKQVQPIVLTRTFVQGVAKLSVDVKSLTINNTKEWLFIPGEPANFTLLIRNSSADWKAEGVYLRLLEISSPKGTNFNPDKNLVLKWNGNETNNIWNATSSVVNESLARVIAPNEQAELNGEFIGLSPGEYNLKLGLALLNGSPDSEQQINLKVEVRDNVSWAVIFLLIAIAISFIANKFLETQYTRSALLRRISEIRPPWLRDEPNTLPVVSVRTLLKQAEDRNRSVWVALFSSTEIVNDRINKAENILKILTRVRRIKEQIIKWNVDKMIRHHGEKRLGKIMADVGWEIGDETFVKGLEAQIESLEKWFVPDQLYFLYWNSLKEDIKNLLSRAKIEEIEAEEDKVKKKYCEIINHLNQDLKSKTDEIDKMIKENKGDKLEENIIQSGHDYAQLKILWETWTDEDTNAKEKMMDLFKNKHKPTIEEVWNKADDLAWERLARAAKKENNTSIEFTSPTINNIQPLQTYQLIQFNIAPNPRILGNSYLYKHGLEYHWHLKVDKRRRKQTKDAAKGDISTQSSSDNAAEVKPEEGKYKFETLTKPVTMEPRLVQYVPVSGRLKVGVTLHRKGVCSKEVKMEDVLPIDNSTDFGIWGVFRSAEITALIIATLFAIISGLASFYISNPVFGSVSDYIALFIWGAGIDQGKKFIQQLKETTSVKGSLSI